ncbi:MAG TPA: hypothetical protein PLE60_08710 [Candidatus Latescibacteria bacterium]|nr:hypothetical protein [Candidatus Latescibacterota bacterium]
MKLAHWGRASIVFMTLAGGAGLFALAGKAWWRHAARDDAHPDYFIDLRYSTRNMRADSVFFCAGAAVGNITPTVPDSFSDQNGDGRFSIGIDTWVDKNRNRRFDAIWLAGEANARPAGGVQDSLYARAIVFGDARHRAAICTVDNFGIFYDDVIAIRALVANLLAEKNDSVEYIAVVATGTMCAPDMMGFWGRSEEETGRDSAYAEQVRRTVAETIVRAATGVRAAVVEEWQRNTSPAKASIVFRAYNGTPIALLSVGAERRSASGQAGVMISADNEKNVAEQASFERFESVAPVHVVLPGMPAGLRGAGVVDSLTDEVAMRENRCAFCIRARTVLAPVGMGSIRTAANLGLIERGFLDGKLRTETAALCLAGIQLVFVPGTIRDPQALHMKGSPVRRHEKRFLVTRANDFLGDLDVLSRDTTRSALPQVSIGLEGRRTIMEQMNLLANDELFRYPQLNNIRDAR